MPAVLWNLPDFHVSWNLPFSAPPPALPEMLHFLPVQQLPCQKPPGHWSVRRLLHCCPLPALPPVPLQPHSLRQKTVFPGYSRWKRHSKTDWRFFSPDRGVPDLLYFYCVTGVLLPYLLSNRKKPVWHQPSRHILLPYFVFFSYIPRYHSPENPAPPDNSYQPH